MTVALGQGGMWRSGTAHPPLSARLVEGGEAAAALVPAWAALAEEQRPATLFHHPVAWTAWAETLGHGGRNPILEMRDGSPHYVTTIKPG